jgi:hypothetical protein
MATDASVVPEEQAITIGDILATIDESWSRLEPLLSRCGPKLSAGPDAGGWNTRQLLSHLVGAWQHIPVHAAFFLAGRDEVPIQLHDKYWIPEWQTAPLEAFVLAMKAAYEGNKVFVRSLDPATLSLSAHTPFGDMTLGELLITSHKNHIADFHIPQLEAFLAR